MDSRIPIFIGWDSRESVAYDVCRYSIERRTDMSKYVIYPLQQDVLRKLGYYYRETKLNDAGKVVDAIDGRPFSTEFSFSRFLVPALANFSGPALYMDCDFLLRDDIANLVKLYDDRYAVSVVKHDYRPEETVKMDGQVQQQYNRKNWSSLMLLNCQHENIQKFLRPETVNRASGRYLHQFGWLDDEEIGELPYQWNYLVGWHYTRDAKAVHFTSGFPMMPGYEKCEYADEWWNEYDHMMKAGKKLGKILDFEV